MQMKDVKIRVGISINQPKQESTLIVPTLGLDKPTLEGKVDVQNNNKVHSENKFENKWVNMDELMEAIEQESFLAIPRSVPDAYGPPSVADFEETYIMPFDIDEAEYSLDEFLKRIQPRFAPTYSFKTRSNNDEKMKFRYRVMYVFKKPFRKLEDYYVFYHYMSGLIGAAAGEYDDEYAYGMNPFSMSVLGCIHKTIRCKHQGKVHYSGRIYSQGMILSDNQLKLLKEDEELCSRIVEKVIDGKERENKLSPLLQGYISNNEYWKINKMPSRKIYMTNSFFKNGFAQVRGNDMFMMLIRKFKWSESDGKYLHVRWEPGERRKRKLKCDISLMRAIDYIDNGMETFTPDELYVAIYKEMKNSFVYIDKKEGDNITLKQLQDWVNDNLEMPITQVIEYCKEINHAYDSGKIGRKRCIGSQNESEPTFINGRLRPRVICESGGDWFPSYIPLKRRRKIGRAVNRFDRILSAYDPYKSLKDNIELIGQMNLCYMVGFHKASLEKFIRIAKEVIEWVDIMKEEKASYDPTDKGNLFKEDWHTCGYGDYSDSIFNIAKWIEEDEDKEDKLRCILEQYEATKCTSKEYADKFWDDVKSGKVSKPKSGRPKSEWQEHFNESAVVNLRPKDVITMVKKQYPDVKDNTIRVWLGKVKKKIIQ